MTRLGALVIAISAALIATDISDAIGAGPNDQGPSVLVQLAKLQRGSLPQIVMAYGSVQPDPSARQTVMAPLSAVVGEIFVRPGERGRRRGTADPPRTEPHRRLPPMPRPGRRCVPRCSSWIARGRMLGEHLATAQQLADAEQSRKRTRALPSLRSTPRVPVDRKSLRAPFPAIVDRRLDDPGRDRRPGRGIARSRTAERARAATSASCRAGRRDPIRRRGQHHAARREDAGRSGKLLLRGRWSIRRRASFRSMSALPPGRFSPARWPRPTS